MKIIFLLFVVGLSTAQAQFATTFFNPTSTSTSINSDVDPDIFTTFFDVTTCDEQTDLALGDILMTMFSTAAMNGDPNTGNLGINPGGTFYNTATGGNNQGGVLYNTANPYSGYGLGNFAFPQVNLLQGRLGYSNNGYQGQVQNRNYRGNYGKNYDYYGFGSGVMFNQPGRRVGSSVSNNFKPNAPFYWYFA
ncbi:uncharacterized protein LOC134836777 [Culicoides brevitarsis]|uniref:uncharacterized protein LOC134836777 n=1 Tax=Culicoides brevitarsis TaxID=469753 RepID=UPI00307C916C